MKQKQNLCLSGATTQELGPCMKSLVRLSIQLKTMKGLIFGGRQRAFVVARLILLGSGGLVCCLHTQCEETTESNELLDA